ncbi:MAG: 30S ribosomal protein S6 [Paracoccaceae bacterium]|nr:30S ribosomal protein S6 [Paracoccaceae bacterium]MDE2674686.1 30S ribosomal protein S6 [Paracoccaceae bacterium]MXZ50534.1 30S ribosomal protein S6 [Paracoccaceae bacterium]MYF45627.1 30S ribosomal protein S6 [Paracoccaceae bacterium]MYG09578.1 30S ribosomal protein S6 [Paracoccaceae bacterium]
MALYEQVCIARQELSNTQVERLSEDIEGILSDKGGSVLYKEYWGARKLAYAIKKNRRGHYLFFRLDSPPEAVIELERRLRLNEDILRYLTTKVDKHSEEPTPILASKQVN